MHPCAYCFAEALEHCSKVAGAAIAQWAKRGETHRELVFELAHGALAKAKLKPPRTFKEAKLADDMARKACGLDINEGVSQSVLVHLNELIEGREPEILEAGVVDAELSPDDSASVFPDSGQQGSSAAIESNARPCTTS
jgi:hypothetical protein